MGYYCTVPQCTSLAGKTKNVKFHRFPRDKVMAEKWNVILKRGKPFTKYSKVCSLHFTHADYNVTTMGQWKTLSKDAMPSQNLPKLNPDGTVMVIRKSRTVKFREVKKEALEQSDKIIADKWSMPVPNHIVPIPECNMVNCPEQTNLPPYRLQSLNAIANAVSPVHQLKPKKQDAIMQTDPVASEDDDSQPNNSYSEVSEQSHTSELEVYQDFKKYAKEDYIPQTNEEYNKEAEKYALERKSHVLDNGYQKLPLEGDYHKVDMYSYEKSYQRGDYYQNGFQDSVELLRNQQHNIQMLQDQHRPAENQNFFNENHIKQEIDVNTDEEKFLYERSKEQLDASAVYSDSQRRLQQQRLFDHIQQQVKREPDTSNGCESVMQPQGSPYYPTNGHSNMSGAYFEQLSRPGPELLIAKQNALAAHTQLWQNTMKRPFFYSENPHYNGPQLLHRYEDLTRILQ